MAIQNVEAEATLLGAMMQQPSLVEKAMEMLSPTDFYEPIHGRIFEAIAQQTLRGNSATPVTLKPLFEHDESLKELGGIAYLARLTGLENSFFGLSDFKGNAEQIADLSKRRKMQLGLMVAADACSDMNATDSEIVGHADAALSIDVNDNIAQISGGDCLGSLLDNLGKQVPGVTGGIQSLDALLGPIRPKQLVIGAGRPGMGKTALALSYAIGAAQQGHGTLFVSLEMSAKELGERMAADLCFYNGEGVPYGAIRDGNLNTWQHKRVAEAYSKMQGVPFQIIDAGSLTTGRLNMLIRRHARRMTAQGEKLELVVVDYLQLLHPDKRHNKYEDISDVSMALKAMAKDHNVGIMALAQLSRTVEQRADKRPQLSDLRDSGQIEQDADKVLFLLRQEYYLRQIDENSPDYAKTQEALRIVEGQIEFIVAKRRDGVTGTATGEFHGAYQAVRG